MENNGLSAKNNSDEAENVEKVLTVVVKRRKKLPIKCMELCKQISTFELLRLENSKVIVEKNVMRENIKRLIQGIKKSKRAQFSQEDLDNAEKKLQIYYKRVKEINMYLKKTKKLDNKAS